MWDKIRVWSKGSHDSTKHKKQQAKVPTVRKKVPPDLEEVLTRKVNPIDLYWDTWTRKQLDLEEKRYS